MNGDDYCGGGKEDFGTGIQANLPARSMKDGGNGLHQYLQIAPQTPVLHVLKIESHINVEGWILARCHLP